MAIKTRRLPRLLICKFCKKEFHPHRSTSKFCSRDCAVKGRPGIRRKTNVLYECDFCKKEFKIEPARLKVTKKHYCSRTCYFKHKKITQTGKLNPNWKGGVDNKSRAKLGTARNYKKGRYYESKTRKILEASGYNVVRSAGSKGPADLIAFNSEEFRLIQVKSGKSPFGPAERERFIELSCPPNTIKELWSWRPPLRKPKIELL